MTIEAPGKRWMVKGLHEPGAAAALVLDRITRRFPFLERIFADARYQGPRVAAAAPRPVEIIRRTDTGFVVLPSAGSSSAPSPGPASTAALPAISSAPPGPSEPFQIAMIKLITRRIARYRDF